MIKDSFFLNKYGYIPLNDSVWHRIEYTNIDYNDGDEIENRIARIVAQASDLTVHSIELREHCSDWASLYHLSSSRVNILRPFKNDIRGNILEIGSGCGAITRYLGECGANVLALEGSLRRASITRSRTRDLDNVVVVCDKFDDFEINCQFDMITLIGVLEYANLFSLSSDPQVAMLKKVRALLKPHGKLILAIENQFGLKYFAGFPEDHLNQPMYGIEGRYRSDQPQTFGRNVLAQLLSEAGFESSYFMAPFPDYKFPISVVTEDGFGCDNFDSSIFAVQSATRDPQSPPIFVFSPERVWPNLVRNGLAMDMANSFVILAEKFKQIKIRSILAYHFSTERQKCYCKETTFILKSDSEISVESSLLVPECKPVSKLLRFTHMPCQQYMLGYPLSAELVEIITRDNWKIEEIASFLHRYIGIIHGYISPNIREYRAISLYFPLPGECFDLVPQNIMVLRDGKIEVVDQEWQLSIEMPLGWLIFRTLLLLLQSVNRVGVSATPNCDTRMAFIKAAFGALGCNVDDVVVNKFAEMEAAVQAEVTQRPIDGLKNWWADSPLPVRNLSLALHEYERRLVEYNRIVLNLQNSIYDVEQQNAECRTNLELIESSFSWRLTAPLRQAFSLLRKLTGRQKKEIVECYANFCSHNLYKRIINGFRRHGLIEGFLAGIRVAGAMSKAWLLKKIASRRYNQRLTELKNIIAEHQGFVDIFHVPMGWSTPLFQRFQHMSLQAVKFGGLSLYGGHAQVDTDMFVYKRAEGGVVVFDALDRRVVECVFNALRLNNNRVILRLQSIDLVTEIEDIQRFVSAGIEVVYEYIDEICEEITGSIPEFVIERHRWLLGNENILAIATSDKLYEQIIRKRKVNCLLSTNGVDLFHWSKASVQPPVDMERVLASGLPVLGYHGALAKWIDYDLLRKIAETGQYELLLIGYEHDKELRDSGILNLPKVHFLGSKSYFNLSQYAQYYSIGILPFKRYVLTESVSPVKLFEYMAASKPIVTTDLLECFKYKSCFVSSSHEEFLNNIKNAISVMDDAKYLAILRKEAMDNSWEHKAKSVYIHLGLIDGLYSSMHDGNKSYIMKKRTFC